MSDRIIGLRQQSAAGFDAFLVSPPVTAFGTSGPPQEQYPFEQHHQQMHYEQEQEEPVYEPMQGYEQYYGEGSNTVMPEQMGGGGWTGEFSVPNSGSSSRRQSGSQPVGLEYLKQPSSEMDRYAQESTFVPSHMQRKSSSDIWYDPGTQQVYQRTSTNSYETSAYPGGGGPQGQFKAPASLPFHLQTDFARQSTLPSQPRSPVLPHSMEASPVAGPSLAGTFSTYTPYQAQSQGLRTSMQASHGPPSPRASRPGSPRSPKSPMMPKMESPVSSGAPSMMGMPAEASWSSITYSQQQQQQGPMAPPAARPSVAQIPLSAHTSPVATSSSQWTTAPSYSSSGFDLMGVLARVASRPDPQIKLGPVDASCSFVVVDARAPDEPIVYASETFSRLTGYSNAEIIGRNCRFLQSPDGQVVKGSERKYSDIKAVSHLRANLNEGKECQASLLNYKKDRRPFVNLTTIVPITWDSDEVAYFVGFQVDLVDQPSSIQEKLRNGTYVVNYGVPPRAAPTALTSAPSIDTREIDGPAPMEVVHEARQATPPRPSTTPELVEAMGIAPLDLDDLETKKAFNRMLLNQCDDFVHVLSLKGSLLYVSQRCKTLLEYEPADMIGKSLSSFCHPSDIVSIMRELKEAGQSGHSTINLLYRMCRKSSGYVWVEATGRLHLEAGKGRKCVILTGRPREVYNLAWSDLERAGGMGKDEYWSKVSLDGMCLHVTPGVASVLGYKAGDLLGASIFRLIADPHQREEVSRALRLADQGHGTTVRIKMQNRKGKEVEVVSNVYPLNAREPLGHARVEQKHYTVIVQTLLPETLKDPSSPISRSSSTSSQYNERSTSLVPSMSIASRPSPSPLYSSSGNVSSSSSGSDTWNSEQASASDNAPSLAFSTFTSTFKTLPHPSTVSDNMFDEIDTTRGTSWQFELHQLKLTNKKLRDEKDMLLAMQKKRLHASARVRAPSVPGERSSQRVCANCGRSNSPEWRAGPTGAKSLCNACGLRWSKARSMSTSGNASSPAAATLSRSNSTSAPAPSSSISPSGAPMLSRSDSASSYQPPLPYSMAPQHEYSDGLIRPKYDSPSTSFGPNFP